MAGVLVTVAALACSACAPAGRSERVVARLGDGIVARVGDLGLTAKTIGRVAAAQRLSTEDALAIVSEDARFAALARREAPVESIRSVERTVLARLVLERLQADERAKGAPTDAEVSEQVARRWWEFDRPAAAKTVHAVIRVKKDGERAKARSLASRLRDTLRGIADPDDFIAAARAFDSEGLELVAQELPATAVDGTVVPSKAPAPGARPGKLVEPYARAANALTTPGELSPVVETSFGYHVILLLERTPAHSIPLEQTRSAVTQDVIELRAKQAQDQLLQRLRGRSKVESARAALDIVGQIKVGQ